MSKGIYQKYADYYDILYRYKNYAKECDFLGKIFKKYSREKVVSILDLGCGTGNHALILAKRGWRITGVDLSARMINLAREKAERLKIDFKQGDARKISLGKKFDVILLMFNVIGYQVSNDDIFAVLQNAARHLKKGGLLVFDCWFGPAVLKQMPGYRRRVEKKGNQEKLIKTAVPNLNILEQTVDIKYEILRVSRGKILDKVNEIHKIRFLFPQEIRHYLDEAGFKVLEICPFLQLNKRPTLNDWNITVIAQKI